MNSSFFHDVDIESTKNMYLSKPSNDRRVGKNYVLMMAVPYNKDKYYGQDTIYRIHNYSFFHVLKGTAVVEINYNKYNLSAGDFLFFPDQTMIQCLDSSDDLRINGILFEPYKFRQEYDPDFSLGFLIRMNKHSEQIVQKHFDILYDIVNSLAMTMDGVNALQYSLYKFVLELKKQQDDSSPPTLTNRHKIFSRFLFLVNKHCKEHHDIGFYAKELNISINYLCQLVKKESKFTAKHWIDKALLKYAQIYLHDEALELKEITKRLGFSDPPHFSRFFSRMMNIPPGEYRKLYGKRNR